MFDIEPSPRPAQVISDPSEAQARLWALDPALDQLIFLEASGSGLRARKEVTRLHAPTAAGTLHWHSLVHALRTILTLRAWLSKDNNNCPMIVSPDKSIAILMMTGCKDTGKKHGQPKNQADKGPVLDAAIQQNNQYDLFESRALHELKRPPSGTQIWVFLYHVDEQQGSVTIRAELSRPSAFKGKKIIAWSDRIILETLSDGPVNVNIADVPQAPIDVSVERRTG